MSDVVPEVVEAIRRQFHAQIDRQDDHWIWAGPTEPSGKPVFHIHSRKRQASRFAYELDGRDLPQNSRLERTCSEPRCVAPAHHELTRNGKGGRKPLPKAIVMRDIDWLHYAVCVGADHRLFFRSECGDYSEAQALCASCPVISHCQEYVIAQGFRNGFAAGMKPSELRQLL